MVLALSLALAAPELECAVPLAAPADRLSVAWVSPLGDRTGANGRIEVVPTVELRAWIRAEEPKLGRLLQWLGERRKATDPRRLFKVVVFDVDAADLCRPIAGQQDPVVVAGVATCAKATSSRAYAGCGVLTDREDSAPSLPVYEVRWSDAARDGFCVLPAERFLAP